MLILLLTFASGSLLISQYLKTDNCKPLIEENLKMQEDFAKISAMLRAERLKKETYTDSSAAEPIGSGIDNTNVMDSILSIAESNNKK